MTFIAVGNGLWAKADNDADAARAVFAKNGQGEIEIHVYRAGDSTVIDNYGRLRWDLGDPEPVYLGKQTMRVIEG